MDENLINELLRKYPAHVNAAGNLITCVGRLSFPALDKPRKMEGSAQEPKYQATLLFPANADLSLIKDKILEAAKAQFPKHDWSKGAPGGFKNCMKRQDDKADKYSGYTAGAFMLSGNNSRPIGMVDARGAVIADPTKLYAGCWVRASVTLRGYDKGGGKGVGCYINNLQFIADDEAFGSGATRAEDDFGVVAEAPAPVATAAAMNGAAPAPASSSLF